MIDYESPVFITILLYTIYALLAAAVGLTVWSMGRSLRMQGRNDAVRHRIPARRIAVLTALVVVLALGATYLLASTSPLTINGRAFTSHFWLRVSDMLINTSAILIVACIAGVGFGMSGLSRKL